MSGEIPYLKTGRGGFTLLEIMFALSIMVAVTIFALIGISGVLRESRTSAMRITASSAVRAQAEEIITAAADAGMPGSTASLVVQYYASAFDKDSEKLQLGPGRELVDRVELTDGNTKLIYRFPVRLTGEKTRGTDGGYAINHSAVGTVTFYLDETSVRPPAGAAEMWYDLGSGGGQQITGFDMNRDGKITSQTAAVSMNLLKNTPEKLDIDQIPVDIAVTFYNNENHDREVYTLERRIVVADSRDLSAMLDP